MIVPAAIAAQGFGFAPIIVAFQGLFVFAETQTITVGGGFPATPEIFNDVLRKNGDEDMIAILLAFVCVQNGS